MPQFAAIDTKFLLALAGDDEDAFGTMDYFTRTRLFPLATESVFEQLGELADVSKSHPAGHFAAKALKYISTWNILVPSNSYVANGTCQTICEKLVQRDLLPDATTLEANLVGEASCHHCHTLVTYSEAILKARRNLTQINLVLRENHLHTIAVIASPRELVERLARLPPSTDPSPAI